MDTDTSNFLAGKEKAGLLTLPFAAPRETAGNFSVETWYPGDFTPFGLHNAFKLLVDPFRTWDTSGPKYEELLWRCPPLLLQAVRPHEVFGEVGGIPASGRSVAAWILTHLPF